VASKYFSLIGMGCEPLSTRSDRFTSYAMGMAAIAIGVSAVYRSFSPSANEKRSPPLTAVSNWQAALPFASRMYGQSAAPVTILELTDLECPACKGFQSVLDSAARKYPDDLQILLVYHPLSYHANAVPAARAGLCATEMGALNRWVHAAFAKQDSFGIKSWGSIAALAGIEDTSAISRCANAATKSEPIDSGLAFGRRISLKGTPTILVNGWKFRGVPTQEELDSVIVAVRAHRSPLKSWPAFK
jgi:protein-disulfide isomerase